MTSDAEQPETPEGMAEEAKAFEDREDAFIAHNREVLAAMVAAARDSLDRVERDRRSVNEIIAEGRARLA